MSTPWSATTSGQSIPHKRRVLGFWIAGYALLVVIMGTNVPSPQYGVYQRIWGFSSGMLSLIFASYAAMLVPTLLLSGQISDRFGRKPLILTGLTLAGAGTALFGAASGTAWLFAGRMVQGLSVGMLVGAVSASLVELQPKPLDRASLVTSMATAGGGGLGPLMAGVLAQYAPAPLRLPYGVEGVLLLLAFMGVLTMPETVTRVAAPRHWWHVQRLGVPANIRAPFWTAAMAAFIAWSVAALFIVMIPVYVPKLLNVHNLAIIGLVVCLMLGGAGLCQVAFRRIRPRLALLGGLTSLIVGLAGLLMAVPLHSLALLLVGTVVAGLGMGLAFMGATAQINRIAPADQRGKIMATFFVTIYVGVGTPIIGIGFAADAIGLYHAVLGYAVLIAVAAAMLNWRVLSLSRLTGAAEDPSTNSD